jgi:hypothetical protein
MTSKTPTGRSKSRGTRMGRDCSITDRFGPVCTILGVIGNWKHAWLGGRSVFAWPPSPQLKAFIDAVPPSDCLAMRHASLAILTLLGTIDYNGLVVEVEDDD